MVVLRREWISVSREFDVRDGFIVSNESRTSRFY